MSGETPIEIIHLPGQLRAIFNGKLPEATNGTDRERETNFLSRALAAYAVHKLASCPVEGAAAAVVDGWGDGGIDAIYYSHATHTLHVVQSKFFVDGRGEPALGDVTKLKEGLSNLLQGKFEAFDANESWKKIIPQLNAVFRDPSLQVRAVLVYSGINLVSEDRRRLFEDLKRRFSHEADYLDVHICNLTTVHDWLIGADTAPGVPEVELTIRKPGWITSPYETVYGLLPLAQLAQLHATHGPRLIAANIRGYKGDTDVNAGIGSTLREEPEHFFYLNNGLTAYCQRLEVNHLDRANAEEKRVRAFGFSVVNGAQTLGAVAKVFEHPPDPAPEGYVFLKIISLERCADDRVFADRITRSTNYQNQIGSRDFVALNEEQERIANQLRLSGISYHFKDDAEAPGPDTANFNLEEATTACACLAQLSDCDFSARTLANRRSLWSFEEVYPAGEENRSRYSRVFRSDRSARTVWRAVQTQRLVIDTMQANARASTGVRKTFFENARWLVLNIVFLRLRPEQGDDLALSSTQAEEISRAATDLSESLWEVCESQGYVSKRSVSGGEQYEQVRHFRSVFSDASDCKRLRDALLAKLAATGSATIATATPNSQTQNQPGISQA